MFSNLADMQRFTTLEGLSSLVMAASHALLKRPLYAIAPTAHGPALIVIADGKPSDIVLGRHDPELLAYLNAHVPNAAPAGSMPAFWDIGVEVLMALDETVAPNGLDQDDVRLWLGAAILGRFRDEAAGRAAHAGNTRH